MRSYFQLSAHLGYDIPSRWRTGHRVKYTTGAMLAITRRNCLRCIRYVYLTHCSEARGQPGSRGQPAAACIAAVC